MPVQPTYPGVYIEEIPSGVHTITGVATSITAFIGRALRGPVNKATTINSFADFERIFGGLWVESTLGYAVRDFYLNGGNQAIIIRLYAPYFTSIQDWQTAHDAAQAVVTAANGVADGKTGADVAAAAQAAANNYPDDPAKTAALFVANAAQNAANNFDSEADTKLAATNALSTVAPITNATFSIAGLQLLAAYPGTWGNNLRAAIDFNILQDVADSMGLAVGDLFNLTVRDTSPGGSTEQFINLTLKNSTRRIDKVLLAESSLVRWNGDPLPSNTYTNTLQTAKQNLPSGQQTVNDSVTAAESSLSSAQKAYTFDKKMSSIAFASKAKADAQNSLTTATKNLDDANAALATAQAAKPPVPADIDKAQKAVKDATDAKQVAQTNADNANKPIPIEYANTQLDAAKAALAAAQTAKPPVPATIKQAQQALQEATQNRDAVQAQYDANAAQAQRDNAKQAMNATDGNQISYNEFSFNLAEANKLGLYALEQADLFNLLCIPPYRLDTKNIDVDLVSEAAAYCERRRAMLLVDPLNEWKDKEKAKTSFTDATTDYIGTRSKNAALFFPRLLQPNPLKNNQVEEFVPCGVVAGIFSRTDSTRGVWKAPAGLDASLVGVPQLTVNLTDNENGELNPLGINCLRAFPIYGRVVWGSRTLRGADQFADEYKYIPVRRTALFIEESLYRGTQWVVFEPNDEPLWAQIRLNIGAFMHNLFRQGAFQGKTPREAYLVKCDSETTTQNDIDLGIVNILVAFAPLKPAEFVIIQIKQLAGQIDV